MGWQGARRPHRVGLRILALLRPADGGQLAGRGVCLNAFTFRCPVHGGGLGREKSGLAHQGHPFARTAVRAQAVDRWDLRATIRVGPRVVLSRRRHRGVPFERSYAMTTFLVIVGIVVVVAGLLALDWFMAPRKGRRMFVRAKNQNTDNVHAGYAEIQRQGQSAQQQTWLP
jgi:hypothetical protein